MKYFFVFLVATLLLAGMRPAQAAHAGCDDVSGRGHFNVLTINILYSSFLHRMERLQPVVDLIGAEQAAGEPVDVILLQEVVSGFLAGTISLSLNLARMLRQQGYDYSLRFMPVTGVPGVFMVGNAILSRCAVAHFASRLLPYAPERPGGGPGIPILHEVQGLTIAMPGYGSADVYNTHLCSYCSGQDRLRQTRSLMRFIDGRQDNDSSPVVLGGDFNTDTALDTDMPAYDFITRDSGFTDTYAAASVCTDCCSNIEGFGGCTYAVPGNPLADDEQPARIDYIFARGQGIAALESRVVFNEAPWVSDHAGVLSRIGLR